MFIGGRSRPRSVTRDPHPWRLTFPQLLAFVAVALPILAALRFAFSTIDLAYLIRAGETMIGTGEIAGRDSFTFTVAGHEWLNQQWGAEIVFALLYRAAGWEALAIARATLVGAVFCLEYAACRAAGAGRRAAAWLTLGAFIVTIDGLTIRPQLLGLAFFALTLWLVAGRRHRPRRLWLLPFVVMVWANMHGSFILAPSLLLLTWLEDRRSDPEGARRVLLAAAACVAAAMVNPYGAGVWAYVVNLTTDPSIREFIQEWQSTRPASLIGASFYLSAVAVAALALKRRHLLPWPRILALVVFLGLGIQAVRGVLWWGLAAPVLIADLFPERDRSRDERSTLNTVLAAVLVLLLIPLSPWFRPRFADDANSFQATDGMLLNAPTGLSDAVRDGTRPGARLFVAQIWASWFELELPGRPVFVDPRIELFPADVWSDYDTVSTAAEDWEGVLDRWEIDALVLSRRQQSDLIDAIGGDPDWVTIHEDEDGIALVRAADDRAALSPP